MSQSHEHMISALRFFVLDVLWHISVKWFQKHDPDLQCPVGDEAVLTDSVAAFIINLSHHNVVSQRHVHRSISWSSEMLNTCGTKQSNNAAYKPISISCFFISFFWVICCFLGRLARLKWIAALNRLISLCILSLLVFLSLSLMKWQFMEIGLDTERESTGCQVGPRPSEIIH